MEEANHTVVGIKGKLFTHIATLSVRPLTAKVASQKRASN